VVKLQVLTAMTVFCNVTPPVFWQKLTDVSEVSGASTTGAIMALLTQAV
jgi:hypothetical protein